MLPIFHNLKDLSDYRRSRCSLERNPNRLPLCLTLALKAMPEPYTSESLFSRCTIPNLPIPNLPHYLWWVLIDWIRLATLIESLRCNTPREILLRESHGVICIPDCAAIPFEIFPRIISG
jgi:hypothetical protein